MIFLDFGNMSYVELAFSRGYACEVLVKWTLVLWFFIVVDDG